MFTTIILDCMDKLRADRSVSGIYHIITGKRSVQSIQDSYIFQLTKYFGIYKSLDFKDFERIIENLEQLKLIDVSSNYSGFLTDKGSKYLEENMDVIKNSGFNGLKYNRITDQFFRRLQLLIQTITNIYSNNKSFIAITDDKQVQAWVKRFYHEHRNDIQNSLNGFHTELSEFLSIIDDEHANLFVDRLSGYNRIGLSKVQLANKYNKSYHEIELLLVEVIHRMLTFHFHHESTTPYLGRLIDDLLDQMFMTDSANYTFRLFQRGYSLSQISAMRGLKENTIQDHFVEISYIYPELILKSFLIEDALINISRVIEETDSKRLKEIKAILKDRYSYFEIRLVLAAKQSDNR